MEELKKLVSKLGIEEARRAGAAKREAARLAEEQEQERRRRAREETALAKEAKAAMEARLSHISRSPTRQAWV